MILTSFEVGLYSGSMGPRTMVYRNHGYRNGAKNDKISDHCFVTNGVRFQWKNELSTVSKRARRDLSLTKGLSLPGRQWIRVILGKLNNIDFFLFEKSIIRYKMGQNWMKFGKIDRDRFFSVSGPRICQYLPKKHGKNKENNGFLDFGRILGDNHGFGKPWFLVPSSLGWKQTFLITPSHRTCTTIVRSRPWPRYGQAGP